MTNKEKIQGLEALLDRQNKRNDVKGAAVTSKEIADLKKLKADDEYIIPSKGKYTKQAATQADLGTATLFDSSKAERRGLKVIVRAGDQGPWLASNEPSIKNVRLRLTAAQWKEMTGYNSMEVGQDAKIDVMLFKQNHYYLNPEGLGGGFATIATEDHYIIPSEMRGKSDTDLAVEREMRRLEAMTATQRAVYEQANRTAAIRAKAASFASLTNAAVVDVEP